MRKRLFCLVALLLAAAAALPGCTGEPARPNEDATVPDHETTSPSQTETQTAAPGPRASAELLDGVFATEVFSYTGLYVEDGSNAPCENVCAVRLSNCSDTHYQYLRFRLTTGGGAYTFAASTLFAGAEMTVLCEEKAAFTDAGIRSAEILAEAPFNEAPTVHLDTLRITYTDAFLTVKNLTDAPIKNLYVYYKNTDENGFFGGITYRTYFGELAAGASIQESAANVKRESTAVVFTTYDP